MSKLRGTSRPLRPTLRPANRRDLGGSLLLGARYGRPLGAPAGGPVGWSGDGGSVAGGSARGLADGLGTFAGGPVGWSVPSCSAPRTCPCRTDPVARPLRRPGLEP